MLSWPEKKIRYLGQIALKFIEDFGNSGYLLFNTLIRPPELRHVFKLLVEQLYSLGVLSLLIIVASGLFIGMVVGLQGYHVLVRFSASAQLGQMVALSIVRELGPVVTALLFAGRACSAMTAEIGLMKATEQLDAMAMMAVDPIRRVIAPRLWGGLISLPALAIIFSAVAIFGGYLVGVEWLGVNAGTFWSNMQASVSFREDVLNGIIKSIVFAIACNWIAIYQGYAAVPTAEGIGRATTKTVVYGSLATLGLDFVLTAVMLGGQ